MYLLFLFFIINNFLSAQNLFSYSKIKQLISENKCNKVIENYKNSNTINIDPKEQFAIAHCFQVLEDYESAIQILNSINLNSLSSRDILTQKLHLSNVCLYAKDWNCTINSIDKFLSYSENNNIQQTEDLQSHVSRLKNIAVIRQKNDDKKFYGSIGFSGLYDTNPFFINKNSIYTTQLQFYSDNQSADFGIMSHINLGYNNKINRNFSLFGNISGYYTRYNKSAQMDSFIGSGLVGFSYNYNKWTIGSYFSYYSIMYDRANIGNTIFLNAYSTNIFGEYNFNKYLTSRLIYQITYSDIRFLNRADISNNLTKQLIFSPFELSTIVFNLTAGYINSSLFYFNYYNYNFYISAKQGIKGVPIYFDFTYYCNVMNFINYDIRLQAKREDLFQDFMIGVHFLVNKNFDIYVNYHYGLNFSNIEAYQYDRQRIIFGFKFIF